MIRKVRISVRWGSDGSTLESDFSVETESKLPRCPPTMCMADCGVD